MIDSDNAISVREPFPHRSHLQQSGTYNKSVKHKTMRELFLQHCGIRPDNSAGFYTQTMFSCLHLSAP